MSTLKKTIIIILLAVSYQATYAQNDIEKIANKEDEILDFLLKVETVSEKHKIVYFELENSADEFELKCVYNKIFVHPYIVSFDKAGYGLYTMLAYKKVTETEIRKLIESCGLRLLKSQLSNQEKLIIKKYCPHYPSRYLKDGTPINYDSYQKRLDEWKLKFPNEFNKMNIRK